MCYSVFLSTDAGEELAKHNSPFISFHKELDNLGPEMAGLMPHPHKWYVGSKSGCSCTFCHLLCIELGFGEPQDWYAEEPDAIEAAKLFYDIVAGLISDGSQVDCMSFWVGATRDKIKHLKVDLACISTETFRFFENHRFSFSSSGKQS
jgi:hypothetical protein